MYATTTHQACRFCMPSMLRGRRQGSFAKKVDQLESKSKDHTSSPGLQTDFRMFPTGRMTFEAVARVVPWSMTPRGRADGTHLGQKAPGVAATGCQTCRAARAVNMITAGHTFSKCETRLPSTVGHLSDKRISPPFYNSYRLSGRWSALADTGKSLQNLV
jgi:hypothetical protein